MDKFDVLSKLQAISPEAKTLLDYLTAVWNTADERTFEEWQAGAQPHDHDGEAL